MHIYIRKICRMMIEEKDTIFLSYDVLRDRIDDQPMLVDKIRASIPIEFLKDGHMPNLLHYDKVSQTKEFLEFIEKL